MTGPRIDHIGIAVVSLDEALAFYQDNLGLQPSAIVEVPHEQVRVAMLPTGLPTGLATGEPRIELLEATSPDSPIARFVEKRGGGIHHIALKLPDLSAAVETMKAGGRRLVTDEIQTGAEGYRYVFVHPKSTGGVLLELIEE